MDFDLTDEQTRIRALARDVALSTLLPRAAETDRTGTWPAETLAAIGQAGLFGITVPTAYGGQGADALSCALAIEELSYACASSGLIVGIQNLLCCEPVLRFGTENQKRSMLPALARGTAFGTAALTQSVGDANPCTVTARATPDDGGVLVDGTATGVVGADYAEWILVMANLSGSSSGRNGGGPTVLIVSRSSEGVRVGRSESLVGARAAHISAVHFDRCAVSATQILGEVGGGRQIAQAARDSGRLAIACQAVGIARAAFEETVANARECGVLAADQSDSQLVALALADMATEIDAARILVWRAARSTASRPTVGAECSMAKVFAAEMSARVTNKAAQMRGYAGFVSNASVERHGRDARIAEVLEGSSDVQRSVIACDVLTK